MASSSISLNSLPLGFRFRPTDKELIDFYLRLKINGHNDDVKVIREIDVCKCEPWDLPDMSVVRSTDPEWFFFCPLDRKYPNGSRLNRATVAGYWKATGKDRTIKSGNKLIGMKKTLVFYTGRAPKGKRTNWVMHEYRTTLDELDGTKPGQGAFVICRLFKKQDESIENSNCDNTEPDLSIPTTAQPSPDEMQSELSPAEQSPDLEKQDLNIPTKLESFTPISSERTISETPAPLDYQLPEATTMQEDSQLEENLKFFIDSPMESSKMFPPLLSQMEAELGLSDMCYPSGDVFSNGVQCPHGINESGDLISTFLNSALNNSDDFSYDDGSVNWMQSTAQKNNGPFNDNGSYTGSEPEVGKPLHLKAVHELSGSLWLDNLDLKIPQEIEMTLGDDDSWQGFGLRNNAAEQEDDPSSSSVLDEVSTWFHGYDESSKPVVNTPDNCNDDTIGTGIKIRPRKPKDQSQRNITSMQGDAPRRVRLQCKNQVHANLCVVSEQEPPHMKEPKAESAIDNSMANSNANRRMVPEFTKSVVPAKRVSGYYSWRKRFAFGSSKASPFRRSPAALMFKVAIAAVLFAMFVGAWRCLSIDAATRTYESKRLINHQDLYTK